MVDGGSVVTGVSGGWWRRVWPAGLVVGELIVRALKPRHCSAPKCRKTFTPRSGLQRACSQPCALAYTRERRAAKERKKSRKWTRVQKEALKTKPMLIKEAQAAFNAYIRARDSGKPCICCGQFPKSDHLTGGQWDAGHFLSVGSHPELRFDEDNCHRQLKSCNAGAGKYRRKDRTVSQQYREGLIARIGMGRVAILESSRPMPHLTHEDLRNIREHYRARVKELRK